MQSRSTSTHPLDNGHVYRIFCKVLHTNIRLWEGSQTYYIISESQIIKYFSVILYHRVRKTLARLRNKDPVKNQTIFGVICWSKISKNTERALCLDFLLF